MENSLSDGKAGDRNIRRLKGKNMRKMMFYMRKMVPKKKERKDMKKICETL